MSAELQESIQAFYKAGYLYQLTRPLVAKLDITLEKEIRTDYLLITVDGWLIMSKSYAWNGATSCPDFDWIIRGSAIHDAGYQLIRLGLLDPSHRNMFDKLLEKHCKEDDAWFGAARIVYIAVDKFGGSAIKPKSEPKEQASPKNR